MSSAYQLWATAAGASFPLYWNSTLVLVEVLKGGEVPLKEENRRGGGMYFDFSVRPL